MNRAPSSAAASLAPLLAAARPPGPLVTTAAWRRLLRAARALPAPLASAIYLECRLASGEPQVDLIVRVDRRGARWLERGAPERAGQGRAVAPESERVGPAHEAAPWLAVAELARAWRRPAHPLAAVLDHLWLEFDVERRPRACPLPPPSVFLGLTAAARGRAGPADPLCALEGAIAGFARSDLDLALRRRPPDATIPYLGFMLARTGGARRLYLGGASALELLEAVRGVRAAGHADEPADRILELIRHAPACVGMVHLDLEASGIVRAGVEITLERAPQHEGRIREQPLLRALAREGLGEPDKLRALGDWPGVRLVAPSEYLFPVRLGRRVNCIKLLWGPDRRLHAKAYLKLTPRPGDPGRPGVAGGVYPVEPARVRRGSPGPTADPKLMR